MCEQEEMCDCKDKNYRFVFDEEYRIIDTEGEIPPIKPDFQTDDGSESGNADALTLMRFLNENIFQAHDIELKCVEEECPKMTFLFEDDISYHSEHMFREVQERIDFEDDPHLLYVFFDMGSVVLDILNPSNHIIVYTDYLEVYNSEKMEHTWIKSSEIKGFVLEPNRTEEMVKELKEVLKDD